MQSHSLTLPYPPSVNHMYGHGRVYLKQPARDYFAAVASKLPSPLVASTVGVIARVHPPDLRKRDIDNTMKCVLDSLTKAGFWEDDKQVKCLMSTWGEKVKGGRVDLQVMENATLLQLAIRYIEDIGGRVIMEVE